MSDFIKVKQYRRGVKYHRDHSGNVKICTATIRACPYSEHFDIQSDANDNSYKYSVSKREETLRFSQDFDNDQRVSPEAKDTIDGRNPDLRTIADKAKDFFYKTGRLPEASIGDIEMSLPGDQRMVLKRTVHDLEMYGLIYTRVDYSARFYTNQNVPGEINSLYVESEDFTFNSKDDYMLFQSHLQQLFTNARERTPDSPETSSAIDKEYADLYEKTIQTVDEVEIMCQGVNEVNKKYGIDLFKQDKPGELNLSGRVSQSTIQPYNIADSLKLHASIDDEVKKITIHFDETYNDVQAFWSVDRTAEGEWYFAFECAGEMNTFNVNKNNIPAMENAIDTILTTAGVKKKYIAQQQEFVRQLFTEIDPAVHNYEYSTKARLESQVKAPVEVKAPQTPPLKEAQTKEEKTKKKLFGLFS